MASGAVIKWSASTVIQLVNRNVLDFKQKIEECVLSRITDSGSW